MDSLLGHGVFANALQLMVVGFAAVNAVAVSSTPIVDLGYAIHQASLSVVRFALTSYDIESLANY
jgi:hypothetical protein